MKPAPTTIFLLRHSRVQTDSPKRYIGTTDLPLSAAGREQARQLADWFSNIDIQAIHSSHLERAMETARTIAACQQLPVVSEPSLGEVCLGEWEGLTFNAVKEMHPVAYRQRGADLAGHRPPGGESFHDLQRRVIPVFQHLVSTGRGNVLVVAHAGVNRVILSHVLGMPLSNLFRIGQSYGGVNIIEVRTTSNLRVQALNLNPCLNKKWNKGMLLTPSTHNGG